MATLKIEITEDQKVRGDFTKKLSGLETNIFCLCKGVYGQDHIGDIGSAIEVLRYSTGYQGHNKFTQYDALLRISLDIHGKEVFYFMSRKWFEIPQAEILESMLFEVSNIQVFDTHEETKFVKVLFDYNNQKDEALEKVLGLRPVYKAVVK